MTAFTLNITCDQTGRVSSDHVGQKLTMYPGDSLILVRSSGWTDADPITSITFYDSTNPATSSYSKITSSSPVVAAWSAAGTANLDGHFSVTTRTSNGVITQVTLTDAQSANSIDWFYVVTIAGRSLDPEVVNKSGQSTPLAPAGWSN